MSDTTTTPAPAPASDNAAPAPGAGRDDAIVLTLRSLQADNASLASEVKARDEKLAAYETELATLRATVETFGKREREAAIVGKLRAALPHLGDFEARAALGALHEAGQVDRYSDKPDEAATAAAELLATNAPALVRPPSPGGGPFRAPPQTPARTQHKSLI